MNFRHWFAGILLASLTSASTSSVANSMETAGGSARHYQQQETESESQDSIKPNAKALKYHGALRRRPTPGYLYDRFFLAWLESSSVKQLEVFLTEQAELENATTNDRLLLAFFFAKQSQDVEALKQFQLALADDPGNSETLLEKAKIEARTLNFEAAIADLEKAAAGQPKSEVAIEVAQLHAKLLMRNQNVDAAQKVLEKLIAENPNDQRLMEDVVELQVKEGQFEPALKLLESLIGKTTDPYQLVIRQLRMGDVLQMSGKRTEALQKYGETLQQTGMDSWLEREILAQIEELFRREDNLQGLLEHYQSMRQADPQRMAIAKSEARFHMELGNTGEALSTYLKVVEATPGDRANREAYIELLSQAGELEKAIAQMQALVEQNSGEADLYLKLAGLKKTADKSSDEIKKSLQDYLTAATKTEFAFMRAARQATVMEMKDTAEAFYRECVQAFPESLTAKEGLAAFLYDQNDKKPEAMQIWTSMATEGDANQLGRVAKILSGRRENQAAFDLLVGRIAEVETSPVLLNILCGEALNLRQYSQAVPWTLKRIRLAENASELDSALTQGLLIIEKAGQSQSLQSQLSSAKKRTVNETCLLSELMERGGKSEQARQNLAAAFEQAKQDADAIALQKIGAQQIRGMVSRLDWAGAARVLETLLELPGGNTTANVRRLVELYLRDGQLETSLTWIDRWKKISPNSVVPWLNEADTLKKLDRHAEALSTLRSATQKFPDDQDLFAKLGQLYFEEGQYKDAERIYWVRYEESKSLSDKVRWAEQLARVAEETGEADALVSQLEQRRRNNPKSLDPLLALASVHRVADNYEGRRSALLEATRLEPENVALLREIARIEEAEGNWEEAIATLTKAQALDASGEVSRQMARIYLAYGEAEKGYQLLLESVGGSQAGPREIEKLVDAMIGMQDWEQALSFIDKQIVEFPDDYRLKYLLGVACVENEQFERAIEVFKDLLSDEQEILGLVKVTNNWRLPPGFENGLPKGTAEWMKLTVLGDLAFSYRDTAPYNYRYGAMGSNIHLPDDVDNCRLLAICQLSDLSKLLEPARVETLRAELQSIGATSAHIAVDPDFEIETIREFAAELATKYPENKDLLGLAVVSSIGREQPDDDQIKILELAIEQFPESEHAIQVLAKLLLVQADAEKYSQQLKSELEKMKDVPADMLVAMALAQIRMMGGMTGNDSGLPEATETAITELLVAWYPELRNQNGSGFGPYLTVMVLQSLESADAETILNFLDDEANSASPAISTPSGFYYSGSEEGVFAKPEFPPKEFSELSQTIVKQIGLDEVVEERFSGFSPFEDEVDTQLPPEEWLAKFQDHLDLVTNPVLKSLLLLKQKKCQLEIEKSDDVPSAMYEEGKTLLQPMLEGSSPKLDAYLMLTGLAGQAQQWDDSRQYLETARNLPMSRDMRRSIDRQLVGIGLASAIGEFESDQAEAITASAKSAALRLRRDQISSAQRQQLVEVFSTLGQTEEAEKLEEQLANQPSSNPYMGGGPVISSADSATRIRELIKDDKHDAAIRLLEQQFNGHASQALNAGYIYYSQDELDTFRNLVNRFKLAPKFLEKLDPGDSKSTRKLSTYAVALELFAEAPEAIAAYRKVLEISDRQDGARMRLLKMLVESESEEIVAELNAVPPKRQESFYQQVNGLLEGASFQQSITLAEAIDKLMESENGVKYAEMFSTFPDNLAGDVKFEPRMSYTTGSLYSDSGAKQLSEMEEELKKTGQDSRKGKRLTKFVSLLKRRIEVHQSLCEKLHAIPATSASAFTSIYQAMNAQGVADAETLLPLARKSLLSAAASTDDSERQMIRQMQMQMPMRYSGLGYYDEQEYASEGTPVEFIISYYGDHLSAVSKLEVEKLEADMRSVGNEATADQLHRALLLYYADEDAFVAQAEALLKEVDSPDQVTFRILDVWEKRKLDVSLDQFWLELTASTAEKKRPRDMQFPISHVTRYVSLLEAANHRERSERVATQFLETVLGDLKDEENLQKLMERMRGGSSDKAIRLQSAMMFVRQLLQSHETMAVGITLAKTYSMDDLLSMLEYAAYEIVESEDADEILRFMDRMGFLADIEQLDPLIYDREVGGSVFGQLLNRMIYIDSKVKDEFAKKVKKLNLKTFGAALVQLSSDSKGKQEDLYNVLGRYLEPFEKLPEERKLEIAQLIHGLAETGSSSYDTSTWKDDAQAALAAVNLARRERANSQFDVLLNARRLDDLPVGRYDSLEWIKEVLAAGDVDHDRMKTAFLKSVKLMEEYNSGGYGYEEASSVFQLAPALLEAKTFASLSVFVDVVSDESMAETQVLHPSTSNEIVEVLKAELNRSDDEPVQKWYQFAQAIRRQMGESEGLPILLPALVGLASETDKDSEKLLNWAVSEVEVAPEDRVAVLIESAFQLAKSTGESASPELPGLADGSAEYLQRLSKLTTPETSLGIQQPIAETLVLLCPDLSADQFWTQAEVLSQAIAMKMEPWPQTVPKLVARATLAIEREANTSGKERSEETTSAADGEIKALSNSLIAYLARSREMYGIDTSRSTLQTYIEFFNKANRTYYISKMARTLRGTSCHLELQTLLMEMDYLEDANRMGVLSFSPRTLQHERLFTKKLGEQLEEFAAIQSRKDRQYLVKLHFAGMANTKQKSEQPATTAKERLRSLLGAFDSIDFKTDNARQSALMVFAFAGVTNDSVRTGLRQLSEGIDPNSITGINSPKDEETLDLWLAYANSELYAGNADVFIDLIRKWRDQQYSDYDFVELQSEVWGVAGPSLLANYDQLSLEQRDVLFAYFQQLPPPDDYYHASELALVSLVFHAVTDRMDDFEKWKLSLGEGVLKEYFDLDDIWKYLAFDEFRSRSLEERLGIIERLWIAGSQIPDSVGSGHFISGVQETCSSCSQRAMGLDAIMESELVTGAELAEYGEPLAELISVNGEIWRQLAKQQVAAGNFNAAKISYEKSLKDANEEMQQAKVNRNLEYAAVLMKLGEKEKADELLQNVDETQLFQSNRDTYKQLKAKQ